MKQVLGINLYTIKETAELLGIHPTSITRYIKEGRLSPSIIGKVKYISEQEIKNFILGIRTKPETSPTQS